MSPVVQNRGISGHTKRTRVLQEFLQKKKFADFESKELGVTLKRMEIYLELCWKKWRNARKGETLRLIYLHWNNKRIHDLIYYNVWIFIQFVPKGCKLLPIETDEDGMKPESLRQVLYRWKPEDAKNPMSDIPRVVYTIPNGVNPTGTSLSTNRRKEIYQVCHMQSLDIENKKTACLCWNRRCENIKKNQENVNAQALQSQ